MNNQMQKEGKTSSMCWGEEERKNQLYDIKERSNPYLMTPSEKGKRLGHPRPDEKRQH